MRTHQQENKDGDDQAHRDADRAHHDNRNANPFSLTNILIAMAMLVGTAMAKQCWTTLQDDLKAGRDAIVGAQKSQQETHDTLLTHGWMLTNLSADVQILKANCMTKDAVDERIRLMSPAIPHASIGSPRTIQNP